MTTTETESTAGVRGGLLVGGLASIAAGMVHATAAGAHSEHRSTVVAFAVLAAFQVGWGALALTPVAARQWVARVGTVGNAAAVGGWLLAKTSGIKFVTGLEEAESPQFADALAAVLAVVAVVGALAVVAPRLVRVPVARFAPLRRGRAVGDSMLVGGAAFVAVAVAVPGMVAAGSHSHAGGHGHDHAASAVPTEPYDATLPVDFSGVDGVTAEQQADAEALATITIQRLPQWADTDTADAAGFRSIGDSDTGFEHYVNWPWIDDAITLDPNHPESLVYRVDGDDRTLVAAMYMLPNGTGLDGVPDIGGALIQWHVHNDLCYSGEPNAWQVAGDGPVPPDEDCPPGTSRRIETAPMIHVWTVPHECGAFASLDGTGGGQIAEGETRACDHVHGSTSSNAISSE